MELRILRKQKGLTQQQLATLLGIKQQYYSRFENNIAEPDIETLCKLADIFEISVDELLGHKTNSYELESISFEDRQAINTFLGLNDLKRAYIRGEINTIAKI